MEQENKREDHLQAPWFAAGAALLVVCWQCAALGSVFERWRMWVFLALNLLLLAILFMSAYNTTPSECKTKEICETKESKTKEKYSESRGAAKLEVVEGGEKQKDLPLSEEELNERAEAFIATFRQQLMSDAKNRKGIHFSATW